MELALEVDDIGRELLLKVLEGGGEETKDLMTPRFLEDLEENRAILQNADLARLQLEERPAWPSSAWSSWTAGGGSMNWD